MTAALKYLKPRMLQGGQRIPGVYDGEDIRVERAEDGWRTEVLCRPIGATRYSEFSRRGVWMDIGVFRTLADAEYARDLLESGLFVLRSPYYSSVDGDVSVTLVKWTDAEAEIKADASICPSSEFQISP